MDKILSPAPLSLDPAALRRQLGLTGDEMTALLTGDPLISLTRQAVLSSLTAAAPADRLRALLRTPPLAGKPFSIAPEALADFLSGADLPEPDLCSLFASAMTLLRDPAAPSALSPEEMLAADRDVFLEKTGLPGSVLLKIAAAQPESTDHPDLALLTAAALLRNQLA